MRCPACGAENPDQASYCSLCYRRFDDKGQALYHANLPSRNGMGEGKRILCPNCQGLNPENTHFCMSCGFIFDEIDQLLVSEEKAAKLEEQRKDREAEVFRKRLSEPVRVDDGLSGAELMRRISAALDAGAVPRLQAKGRNSITHMMKLLALASEEREREGRTLTFRVRLAEEVAMPDLEQVELEVILWEGDGRPPMPS